MVRKKKKNFGPKRGSTDAFDLSQVVGFGAWMAADLPTGHESLESTCC